MHQSVLSKNTDENDDSPTIHRDIITPETNFPFLLFSSRQTEYCLKKEQKVLRDYFALSGNMAGAGSIR